MKRKLILLFVLFSVLMCAGSVWYWTRSGNRVDEITLEPRENLHLRLWTSNGKLMMSRTDHPAAAVAAPGGKISWTSTPAAAPVAATVGTETEVTAFSYRSTPLADKSGGMESTLALPIWLIAAFFAVAPLMWCTSKVGSKPRKKPEGAK